MNWLLGNTLHGPISYLITRYSRSTRNRRLTPSISEIAERRSMERTSLTRGAKLPEASDLIERSGETLPDSEGGKKYMRHL